MNVLIIVPRLSEIDDLSFNYALPLGLMYISSVLKQAGHVVDCLNLNHCSGRVNDLIKQALAHKNYYFVATGGISTFYKRIKDVVAAVRKSNQEIRIIIGGGLVSSEPEVMFNALKPDFIILGEGEKTVVELLSCLQNNDDISQVQGIAFKGIDGKFMRNKGRDPIDDLDALPYPDFEGFEYEKYLENMHPSQSNDLDLFDFPRMYPIICSRSCPFLCSFCFHPLGNKYRSRSVDSVMQELEARVKYYRINIISIYDELFTNNREWLQEFCVRIKEFLKTLSWECKWSCQMRVNDVDDEVLSMMQEAGCYWISYGFESYSPVVLKSMKKHITPQMISNSIRVTMKNKISIQGNFIFFDPAETEETVQDTLSFWKDNLDAGIHLGFVNPYPGTEIYRKCLEKRIIENKLDFIENHIFDTPNMGEMPDNKFEKLKLKIIAHKLRFRMYSRQSSVTKEGKGVYRVKALCPHCGQKSEYKNYLLETKHLYFFPLYCRACRKRYYVASLWYKSIAYSLVFFYQAVPNLAYFMIHRVRPFLRSRKNYFKALINRIYYKRSKTY